MTVSHMSARTYMHGTNHVSFDFSSSAVYTLADPTDRKYTKSHEWAKVDDDVATVGISSHAQAELGDIVFVELPEVGSDAEKGKHAVTVESVKASASVYAPVNGEVVEVNEGLSDTPELINSDPYSDGWLFKVKVSDPSELEDLMPSSEYETTLGDK